MRPPAPDPPAPRWPARVLIGLLALHAVLAWLALQATVVFIELTWRVAAGSFELRPLLATHVGQFRGLRLVQAALWLALGAAVVGCRRAARRDLSRSGGLPYAPAGATAVRWARVLLLSAAAVDVVARALALWSGGPLDLGPATMALVVGQILAAAAAIVGIWVLVTGRAHENR